MEASIMKRMLSIAVAAALGAGLALTQAPRSAEVQLKAAEHKQQVEGVCFEWADAQGAPSSTLLEDSRLWGALLAATALSCWVVFR
jgi:hypothetical protein